MIKPQLAMPIIGLGLSTALSAEQTTQPNYLLWNEQPAGTAATPQFTAMARIDARSTTPAQAASALYTELTARPRPAGHLSIMLQNFGGTPAAVANLFFVDPLIPLDTRTRFGYTNACAGRRVATLRAAELIHKGP